MTKEEKIEKATQIIVTYSNKWGVNVDLKARELATEIVNLATEDMKLL